MRLTIISILCLAFSFPLIVSGQIYSIGRDTAVTTAYLPSDSIFIYNKKGTASPTGTLLVKVSQGAAVFQWSRYNPVNASWEPIQGASSDTLYKVESGGYKVTVTVNSTIQEYVAWVFINDFNLQLDKETDTGEVLFFSSTCDYLDLRVINPRPALFTYYNPSNNQAITLPNRLKYRWGSDQNVEIFEVDTFMNIRFRKERLPYDPTIFYVYATDNYKLTRQDNVKYPPILSKAKFDTARVEYMIDRQYSAPAKVWFKNQSKNAVKYNWNFSDGDTIERYDTVMIEHTFLKSNKTYTVTLRTESERYCIDTVSMKIPVAPAEVGSQSSNGIYEVPNVFTPNNDGNNDEIYVYFKSISVHSFRFSIFSRIGIKVYEYSGNSSDLATGRWKGWDGKFHGSDVSEGIYYYVLEIMTFEESTPQNQKIHKDGVYKGFFYLFR